MKKILSILMLALLVAVPFEASAKKKATGKSRAKSSSSAVVKGAVKEYGDYLTTQVFTYNKGRNKFKVEYPIAGNPDLVSSVRNWIKDMVDDTFKGSLSTPDALLKTAASKLMSDENVVQDIKVVYDNSKIISFLNDYYWYGGGAHGDASQPGATFRVSDGMEFDSDMLPAFSAMKDKIKAGLAKYWNTSVANLNDYFFNSDSLAAYPGSIYITGDGIVFQYDQYEIAPYSEGMPKAVVPVDKSVLQSLTPEGRSFF